MSGELSKFVEIRLHVDDQKEAERSARFTEYQISLSGSKALPNYIVIDPAAHQKAKAIYKENPIDPTRLSKWLRENSKP